MKKTLKDLKPNEAIHCKTLEEVQGICAAMDSAGIERPFKAKDAWDECGDMLYVKTSKETGMAWGFVYDLSPNRYVIYPASDFLPSAYPSQPERVEGVWRQRSQIYQAEKYNGGDTIMGKEVLRHQCDYRMCDVCGGDNQPHFIIKQERRTSLIIKIGDYLLIEQDTGNLSVYSEDSFNKRFEPLPAAPSAVDWDEVRNMLTGIAMDNVSVDDVLFNLKNCFNYTLTAKD